jgi:6-pyruvoyltetrahydropterin/6-carboxytetrahydropterin synthase
VRVRRRFEFEAAHQLPRHPGKCRDLHGHSYTLVVSVDRPVDDETGMAVDFADLKQIVRQAVIDRLDHRYVNDLIENPTAERMSIWIWNELRPLLPGLVEIELHETSRCSVVYRGEE